MTGPERLWSADSESFEDLLNWVDYAPPVSTWGLSLGHTTGESFEAARRAQDRMRPARIRYQHHGPDTGTLLGRQEDDRGA